MPRRFALIRTEDQWRRVRHEHTALEGEVVSLMWEQAANGGAPAGTPAGRAGLAFDSVCRLYRCVPQAGCVERLRWTARGTTTSAPESVDVFEEGLDRTPGDFSAAAPASALLEPRGIALDAADRLFVAETGARRIVVVGLTARRLLRRVALPGRPVALAALGRRVYAVLQDPAGLVRMEAHSGPRAVQLPAAVLAPSGIAICPLGNVFLLDKAGSADARLVPLAHPENARAVPYATDIAFEARSGAAGNCAGYVLVVARRPGEDFLRFRVSPAGWSESTPLTARGYDGSGIAATPDGRIVFWTARGFRHAVAARLKYFSEGRVTTFRLDSGEYQTVWGRLFLDACIPAGTEIRIDCATADEPPAGAHLAWKRPENAPELDPPHPELSPAMQPEALAPGAGDVTGRLHRRETGRELPWARSESGDAFQTCEAPILAGPGRFLWVTLELTGNTRTTPKVRALRAEYPSHALLARLPRVYSERDADAASFLRRYLAIADGALDELDAKAAARHALIDPRSAPPELLPWLGGFMGLVLDERWPAQVRRALVENAALLFRFRGTVPGVRKLVEIVTGVKPVLVERFQVRGSAGRLAGPRTEGTALVGTSLRVGGRAGEEQGAVSADAFETNAHRFTVVVPASLGAAQRAALEHALDVHRPAHTLYEICTIGAGMRVGWGLHIGLTSMIGRTGGFQSLRLGDAIVGQGLVLGEPLPGMSLGDARLDQDARVG